MRAGAFPTNPVFLLPKSPHAVWYTACGSMFDNSSSQPAPSRGCWANPNSRDISHFRLCMNFPVLPPAEVSGRKVAGRGSGREKSTQLPGCDQIPFLRFLGRVRGGEQVKRPQCGVFTKRYPTKQGAEGGSRATDAPRLCDRGGQGEAERNGTRVVNDSPGDGQSPRVSEPAGEKCCRRQATGGLFRLLLREKVAHEV